jgi:hypothetical protein
MKASYISTSPAMLSLINALLTKCSLNTRQALLRSLPGHPFLDGKDCCVQPFTSCRGPCSIQRVPSGRVPLHSVALRTIGPSVFTTYSRPILVKRFQLAHAFSWEEQMIMFVPLPLPLPICTSRHTECAFVDIKATSLSFSLDMSTGDRSPKSTS